MVAKKKPTKKTKSPKAKKSIKITGKPKAKVVVDKELDAMTVAALRKVCQDLGVEECKGKSAIAKATLIRYIVDARARGISPKKPSPKKPSPKKSPKKAKKVKKSPAPKKSPKPKKTPKKVGKKKKASPQKVEIPSYEDQTLSELKSLCKKRKIDTARCGPKKTDVIAALQEWDEIQIGEVRDCYKNGKPVCGTDACETDTGKCVKPKSVKKSSYARFGDDFYYDKASGLIGKRADVLAQLKAFGLPLPGEASPKKGAGKKKKASPKKSPSTKPKPPKKSPKPKKTPKKKAKRCDAKDDWLDCDEGQVCSAKSGKCVKGKPAKGMWVLVIEGRPSIVGEESVIKELQRVMGGKAQKAGEKVAEETSLSNRKRRRNRLR